MALEPSQQRPLHGKKLGLLCGVADDHDARLFTRAANVLGAQVALLRPSLSASSSAAEVQRTARVLGRLYEALGCIGMPHDLLLRIGADAGVPVFDGLASVANASGRFARLSAAEPDSDEWRCAAIQALLLSVLC
jgi:ornithine carbamoyltransferase